MAIVELKNGNCSAIQWVASELLCSCAIFLDWILGDHEILVSPLVYERERERVDLLGKSVAKCHFNRSREIY